MNYQLTFKATVIAASLLGLAACSSSDDPVAADPTSGNGTNTGGTTTAGSGTTTGDVSTAGEGTTIGEGATTGGGVTTGEGATTGEGCGPVILATP